MANFGTLEFVLDRYSGTWCWKFSGTRAVNMVSKLIPRGWYGDKPDEVIVSDTDENIKKLKMIDDRYPFEILSKSVWKRKIIPLTIKKQKTPKIEKLSQAVPSKQFRGELLDFQREGLDFLMKSSGNALLADEMGLGKTVQTLAYLSKEKNAFPALVIAPLVTLTNWQREIEKFLKKKSRNGKIIDGKTPTSVMIRNGKLNDIGPVSYTHLTLPTILLV